MEKRSGTPTSPKQPHAQSVGFAASASIAARSPCMRHPEPFDFRAVHEARIQVAHFLLCRPLYPVGALPTSSIMARRFFSERSFKLLGTIRSSTCLQDIKRLKPRAVHVPVEIGLGTDALLHHGEVYPRAGWRCLACNKQERKSRGQKGTSS